MSWKQKIKNDKGSILDPFFVCIDRFYSTKKGRLFRLKKGTDRRCKTIWEQQNTKHDPRMDLDWMNNVV